LIGKETEYRKSTVPPVAFFDGFLYSLYRDLEGKRLPVLASRLDFIFSVIPHVRPDLMGSPVLLSS
jgi:hypothetical protein